MFLMERKGWVGVCVVWFDWRLGGLFIFVVGGVEVGGGWIC